MRHYFFNNKINIHGGVHRYIFYNKINIYSSVLCYIFTTKLIPIAVYVGNSDDKPGRRSCIKTDYTLGMFVNLQSIKDFAKCISVPVKAIALAQPVGKTYSSKAEDVPCLFLAIEHNRGCCAAHYKLFYPLLSDKGGAMMGLQYLCPSEVGHRGCDCKYPLCRQMGYFLSKPGAINIPVSA